MRFHPGLLLALTSLALLGACATTTPYVYGGTGLVQVNSSTGNSSNFNGAVDEDSTALSLGVGAELSENFAIEAGYLDLSSYSWQGRWKGANNSGHVNTDGFAYSLLGKLPLSERFSVFGRAGLYFWEAEAYENAAGTTLNGKNHSNSPLLGIGVQGELFKPLDLRLEWTHLNDVWDDSVEVFQLQAVYAF